MQGAWEWDGWSAKWLSRGLRTGKTTREEVLQAACGTPLPDLEGWGELAVNSLTVFRFTDPFCSQLNKTPYPSDVRDGSDVPAGELCAHQKLKRNTLGPRHQYTKDGAAG